MKKNNEENKNNKESILLFDVGATWTRFAFLTNKKIVSKKIIKTSDFTLGDIKKIISESGKNISRVIISCAGPVVNGKCSMTHTNLVFDERSLSVILGIKVDVINDLVAAANALKEKNKGSLLIGPGTGLGVSIISSIGEIISSEEGHNKIRRELFLSIPEFRHVNIPDYETVLSGKYNVLLRIFKKEQATLEKDRFTQIYLLMLDEFIQEMLSRYKDKGIKKIILLGGVISGNKKFFLQYSKTLKKKFKKEIKIIDDKFLCLEGLAKTIHN